MRFARYLFSGASCAAALALTAAGTDALKVTSPGDDPKDATAVIQKALDSGVRQVVIGREGSPYVVRPLFVRSDTELLFEEGVELVAKEGEFRDRFDALVTLHGVTNVTLRGLGKGATFRMRIKDYQSAAYEHGEWRHAVNLLSAVNVTVENLTLADSGGDGIYVGANPMLSPCRNIAIRSCVCDNNNRQGISVISADGLLIERTVMKNTRGTAPKSGIDFEPNDRRQLLKNIVMRDCLTEGNAGSGYEVYLGKGLCGTVDITLEDCRSVDDVCAGLKVAFATSDLTPDIGRGGAVRVRNCTFSGCKSAAVTLINKPAGVADVTMENCVIERRADIAKGIPDICLPTSNRLAPPADGLTLRNVTIRRKDAEGWFNVAKMPWSKVGMDNVRGKVTLELDGGRSETVELDEAWRRAVFPRTSERYVLDSVAFDPARVSRIVDAAPGKTAALAPMTFRFGLDAWVYAAQPGPVTFAVRLVHVNSSKVKDGRFTVVDARGSKVATLPAASESVEERTFNAPAAGFYRITCDMAPQGLAFTSCNAPIGFLAVERYALDVFRSVGSIFFAHGAGVDETLFCGGSGEAATISLHDPDGKGRGVWRNLMDWAFVRMAPDDAEGLWRIDVARPEGGYVWEDTCFDRTGTPPMFFLTSEKYWISGNKAK